MTDPAQETFEEFEERLGLGTKSFSRSRTAEILGCGEMAALTWSWDETPRLSHWQRTVVRAVLQRRSSCNAFSNFSQLL